MRALARGLMVLLTGVTLLVAPSVAAASGKPVIRSFTASTTTLPQQGGKVYLTIRARHAINCQLVGDFGHKVYSCSSGTLTVWARIVANTGPSPLTYRVSIEVINVNGFVRTRTITITQAGEPQVQTGPTGPSTTAIAPPSTAPPPPVVGLDACTAGPDCDYGPIYNTYSNYGNVAPSNLGDCTFAAAANWEEILLGVTPDPAVIGYEFANAGGTPNGLTQSGLWNYWMTDGISGEYLAGYHSYYTDQTDVQNGVRDYGAMIVEFRFINNDYFGNIVVTAGGHDAVVDGFTPEGPLVVSWGQTIQMTWQQWNAEVVYMWGIAAGPTPTPF
jgi:hypothetical protein